MPKIRTIGGVVKNVSDRDAKLLILVKRATLVDDAPSQEAPTPEVADMDESEPVKRKYRTKTMKAD